ncbi:hypothetical protein [Candidatus Nitrospira allomarina]|uniref:Uncharacterized protein n=1 Tax=Candidatus Nitrospira allomarina TaxID=3020900 RepID=A0AA96GCW6_9BACT|nr:hypothetical protein [Candidatus Nitrospira allomarina]WNM59286.1 hypothetical protein PP769_05835 [Candidatus Nitrospira allomarina]
MKWLPRFEWPNPQQLKSTTLVVLLIGTLSIVGWVSLDKLFTIQKRQSLTQDAIGLEQQVSELRSQYLQARPDALDTHLQLAEQRLLHSFTHLAQWAQTLQIDGKQWNLLIQYRILSTERTTSPIQGVTLVPLEIQVNSQGTPNAYRSYLQFLKALTRSGPRVDIQNVTVMGDGQQATHLTIGLSVWMKINDSVEL